MAFTRISEPVPNTGNISALPDRPTLSPTDLKALFDKGPTDLAHTELLDIINQINAFLTTLESAGAARLVGAEKIDDSDNYDANIYAKFAFLKNYIDQKQILASAADMRQITYDSNSDGIVNNSDLFAGHGVDYFMLANSKGVAGGVTPLGDDGKVNASFLPQISASNIVGDSTFNGTAGRVITHTVGSTNYSVCWEPTQATNGTVGEVWMTMAANSFTIYNTGSYVGGFRYVILRG